MKATFAKVLGLALALALALSGCNLIEIDAKMQADEDIAKIDKAYAKVVGSYDGGEVTVAEVIGDFNAAYNETAQMYYYYFGYEMTHDDVHMLAEDSIAARVRSEIAAAKFDEAGELTEEEMTEAENEIQETYELYLESAMDYAEGRNDEAKAENARVLMRQVGVDYDSLYDNVLTRTKETRMEELLAEEITEVSEEELQAAYDAKVEEQQSLYTDGSSFESDMSGSEDVIVCWRPDGYRTVKHILVMPSDEIKAKYSNAVSDFEASRSDIELLEDELAEANDDDIAEGERTPEEIQAEIDAILAVIPDQQAAIEAAKQACLNDVKAVTDEIYARLAAGEAFEDLIAEYGEDPGMQNEPAMSRGYYVSRASQNWEVNFRDAAMALTQVGEYSAEPVVSGSGVHIIQYTADVLGGEVPLDEIREALTAETLTELKEKHAEDTISAWVEAAAPSYDAEALEAAYGTEY